MRTIALFVFVLHLGYFGFCALPDTTHYHYSDLVFHKAVRHADIVYGKNTWQSGKHQNLTLDFYEAEGDTAAQRPLIILAHGGFFLFGQKEDFTLEAEDLAKSGFAVASINYRLLDVAESEVSYKRAVIDAVFDMKAAVRFFRRDAATVNNFRIDPDNIFIGGYSAGAITSLHYGYINDPRDVYGIGGNLMLSYIRRHGGEDGDSGNPGYSSDVNGVINIAGSLDHAGLVDNNEPPLLSIHGTADNIVPFNTGESGDSGIKTEGSGLIHQRANEVGLANKLIKIDGGDHFAFFTCAICPFEIREFIIRNLKY